MGYRCYIRKKDEDELDAIELPKFYGYVKNEGLLSVEFLAKRGYIGEITSEFYYRSFGPEIEFPFEDFVVWICLYILDIYLYRKNNPSLPHGVPLEVSFEEYPKLKQLMFDDSTKIVEWG